MLYGLFLSDLSALPGNSSQGLDLGLKLLPLDACLIGRQPSYPHVPEPQAKFCFSSRVQQVDMTTCMSISVRLKDIIKVWNVSVNLFGSPGKQPSLILHWVWSVIEYVTQTLRVSVSPSFTTFLRGQFGGFWVVRGSTPSVSHGTGSGSSLWQRVGIWEHKEEVM